MINELKESLSDPKDVCWSGLQEVTFQGTRLAKHIAGNPTSVRSMNVTMLRNFVNTYYGHKNQMIICLTSELSLTQGKQLLQRYFSEIPSYECKKIPRILKDQTRVLYPDHVFHLRTGRLRFTRDTSKHSFIGISFPSYRYQEGSTKKNYAMRLISELLTGYLSSYLYQELRQTRGLIYHIHSASELFEDLGFFYIMCSTDNHQSRVVETIETILEFVNSLSTRVTEDVLESSKSHMVRQLSLQDKAVHKIGYRTCRDLMYRGKVFTKTQETQQIKSITLKDIQEASKEVFQGKHCCISYTGSNEYV